MYYIEQLISNSVLQCAILSWLTAQIIKTVIYFIKNKKADFSQMIASGGMPSSHSSFSVSAAVKIGLTDGFESTVFALAAVVAIIVMYDASGVRRSVGKHAGLLNKITGGKLNVAVGHSPIEVCAGALLGIIIALLMKNNA